MYCNLLARYMPARGLWFIPQITNASLVTFFCTVSKHFLQRLFCVMGDSIVSRLGHRTGDSVVVSSIPGHCSVGKLFTPLCFCYQAVYLVLVLGRWCSSAGKVTRGLAESNGSLLPGGWLKITCGMSACTPGSASVPTLSNEYGRTIPYLLPVTKVTTSAISCLRTESNVSI